MVHKGGVLEVPPRLGEGSATARRRRVPLSSCGREGHGESKGGEREREDETRRQEKTP